MKILLLLFLTIHTILPASQAICAFGKDVLVHVYNDNLPSNSTLKIHCASGDKELGIHILKPNEDFSWKFCVGFRTKFFCHLWWGSKQRAFDVFTAKPKFNHNNFWSARADGIYYSYAEYGPYTKRFNWENE
ncbi:hypothetical protein CASFOL_041801 [Castilleja foliolosa]|uniref:S-protein homolog n=1 Tax=Castilleja foliolosa TaxID=1961234 RepID=A0ABD3B9Y4_9LAMI